MKSKRLVFVVLFLAFLAAGSLDYQSEVEEETIYHTNVCDGFWPDYKDLKPVCGGDK